jgi:hypothetical protein
MPGWRISFVQQFASAPLVPQPFTVTASESPTAIDCGAIHVRIRENPAFLPFFAWHEKSLLEYSASFAHCALR